MDYKARPIEALREITFLRPNGVLMKRMLSSRWIQFCAVFFLLVALAELYTRVTSALPPRPRSIVQLNYCPDILRFSPDNRFLVTAQQLPHRSGSQNPTWCDWPYPHRKLCELDLWNVETGVRLCSPSKEFSYINVLAFS